MKNALLALNAVLLIAVIVLYVLFFTNRPAQGTPTAVRRPADSLAPASSGSLPIAYVNTDTLQANYEYYKTLKAEVEKSQKRLENEFAARQRAFQNEVVSFQKNGATMTLEQQQRTQQMLAGKERDLRLYGDQLQQRMLKETEDKTDAIRKRITEYLTQYGREHNYQMILGYQTQLNTIWYAENGLDVTQDALKGLNEAYKASQATPAEQGK